MVPAQVLNVKKKALGDVSNTVTQKVLTTKPNDAPLKPSEGSCISVQNSAPITCKPVVEVKGMEVKKEVEEPQAVSFDGRLFEFSFYSLVFVYMLIEFVSCRLGL